MTGNRTGRGRVTGWDAYATPRLAELRNAPGAAVCVDEDCNLSGGYAHIGPCEACQCGSDYAVAECGCMALAALAAGKRGE